MRLRLGVLLYAALAVSAAEAQHVHERTTALFEAREASGTAWQPSGTSMHGTHLTWRGWDLMLHGTAFAQFIYEPGERHRTGGTSTTQTSSVNWGMVMARRPAGAGRFGVRAMATAEPWTVRDCGFLNLLATGEVCDGDTIHDRQHPHDLFMELAAEYDRPVRGAWRWQLYGGLAGEPALGPPGFPHRASAALNPVAPIGHHWLDSSHITFGLVTTGIYNPRWKLETSIFNGREPDAARTGFDLAALDSQSVRLTVMPAPPLVVQVSAAYLREAEAELGPVPRTDLRRATASIAYHHMLGTGAVWATTAAIGLNGGHEGGTGESLNRVTAAALVETAIDIGARQSWFGRAEVVQKPAHDLHAHEFDGTIFTVAKLQAGYVRHLKPWGPLTPGVGATASISLLPDELAPRYSGNVAPGFGVFLVVRPRP